jgi:hypothetical protein
LFLYLKLPLIERPPLKSFFNGELVRHFQITDNSSQLLQSGHTSPRYGGETLRSNEVTAFPIHESSFLNLRSDEGHLKKSLNRWAAIIDHSQRTVFDCPVYLFSAAT